MTMMSKTMLIPYVLLGHKPQSNYKYIDFLTEYRKPSDSISSLTRHDLSSLTVEFDGLEISEQRVFLLYDELSCPVQELESQFEKILDNKSLRLKAAECNIEDTFESLDLAPYTDGKVKSVRLVVVAHFSSSASRTTAPQELPVEAEADVQFDERDRVIESAKRRGDPSVESRNINYIHSQVYERPDAAFNARPLDLMPSDISIYEPAFAKFIDKLSRPPQDGRLSSDELGRAFDFIHVATDAYNDEGDRQRDLSKLNALHGEVLWVDADMQESNAIDDHDVDAVVDDQPRFPSTIFLSGLDTDPSFHAGLIYIKLASSDEFENLRWGSCCPVFILAKADRILSVWGAVFADRFFFQRLSSVFLGHCTNGVPIGKTPLEGSIQEVAQLFRLMSEAVADFEKYQKNNHISRIGLVDSHTNASTNNAERLSIVPAPGQFPRWNIFDSDFSGVQKTYTITYKRRLTGRFDKPLYKATMKAIDESKVYRVVVKFTHRYGIEGHELLAKEHLAPTVYFARHLDSESGGPGMWAVVMEYIDGETSVFDKASEEQKKKLQDAVSILHRGGFVFGKLQGSNVCLRGKDEMYLLGFDWCSREKEGRYPADIGWNRSTKWHEDVGPCQQIEKEHDLYRMKALLGGEE